MYQKQRKAFSMLELTFVVVIIGILSAVAIPKFSVSRSDAVIVNAKNVVSSVRGALAAKKQKNILSGVFTPITNLSTSTGAGANKYVFDGFGGIAADSVLTYPVPACVATTDRECWYMPDTTTYRFNMPVSGSVDFNITNNTFICKVPTSVNCKRLTQ